MLKACFKTEKRVKTCFSVLKHVFYFEKRVITCFFSKRHVLTHLVIFLAAKRI